MFGTERQVGVRLHEGPVQTGRGTPRTLTNAVPCEMVACEYCDDAGKKHVAVVVKVGAKHYMPPNSEQWAAALRPVSEWLQEAIDREISSKDAPIPSEDAVDMAVGEVSKEMAEGQGSSPMPSQNVDV